MLCAVAVVMGCGSPATPAQVPVTEVGNEQPAEVVDRQPSTAVAVVIDRSGSMQGPKLESAKLGAIELADALPDGALFTTIAFDADAMTVVRLQDAANRERIEEELDALTAGGGTNYFPALQMAFETLAVVDAERRLVLFLSDGEAPYEGVLELVDEMSANRIRTSTIGLGGADANLLGMIAEHGLGTLWMVEDPAELGAVMRRAIE